MRLKSTTKPKGPSSSAAAAPAPSPSDDVGREIFGYWPETHNALGKSFDICVHPSKLGCVAHRDFYGCTRCKGGFKPVVAKGLLEGVKVCVPVKQGGWYDGSPRL